MDDQKTCAEPAELEAELTRLKQRIRALGCDPDAKWCRCCGETVKLAWRAPDDLWAVVTRGERGALCLACFTVFAEHADIALYWSPHAVLK